MNFSLKRALSLVVIAVFGVFAVIVFLGSGGDFKTSAQEADPAPNATPEPKFDQKAALAAIREKIKGKEKLPAGEVYKNVQNFAQMPAGRLLAVMEFGYSRSLGVDCTHCHVEGRWASEAKPQKQTAREMHKMVARINGELLPGIKAFEGREGRNRAVVNCTTCHRGQVIPATNLGK